MKNTEYKDVFDIGKEALSPKFSNSSFPTIKNSFTIGENIRGMANTSPLATVKFSNQSIKDISVKYYPDAQNIKSNNSNLVLDESIKKNGYDFYKYEFFSDKNRNGSVEKNEELIFKLLLFVSTDGNKVKECYEVVKPAEDEIIFFLETDDDTLSDDVLFGRTSEKIKKLYTDHSSGKLYKTFFDGDILDKIKKHAGNINQEIIEELFLKGFIEKKGIKQGFFTFLKYTLMGIFAPAKALGWVLNKLGSGIDFLKISDEVWDTENEGYYFQKDKLIENLTISSDKLKSLKDFFTDKKDFNVLSSDITKLILDNIILQQITILEAFIEIYNSKVTAEIEEIFKTFEDLPPSDSPTLSERIALISGIWNGLIEFVSSIFTFFGSLLEAPFDIRKNFQQTLEMIDTFLGMLKDGTLYENMKSSFSYGITNIVQYLKKNSDDINWIRVYYIGGFSFAFLGTFFIPLANVVKIANAGKVGEILAKINSEVGKTIAQTVKFVKINSIQAYQKVSRALIDLLEIFNIGGQKLKKFVDDLWKKIAEWFIKNKKILNEYKEKILEKIKKYFKKSKFPIHKTTKMLSKYIGEETGNGWCAPNAVKYLDDVERLEYELAIVDGKLYSKNGRLFDTAFAGEGKIITQKAIFVMDKEGRIFATNAPERFYFHHSSFLGGGEVAAAGEIKVSQGVIEFISKQSGHYQPTKKYMLQLMKVLEENSIDVNKIIVEF